MDNAAKKCLITLAEMYSAMRKMPSAPEEMQPSKTGMDIVTEKMAIATGEMEPPMTGMDMAAEKMPVTREGIYCAGRKMDNAV